MEINASAIESNEDLLAVRERTKMIFAANDPVIVKVLPIQQVTAFMFDQVILVFAGDAWSKHGRHCAVFPSTQLPRLGGVE
jgi:hypothetical protein